MHEIQIVRVMLGAIIGDTIGSIYEFNNIHTTDFPLFSPTSTFTDDSIMTMVVAEWLLTDEHHTQSSLIEIMEAYYSDFPNPIFSTSVHGPSTVHERSIIGG